MSFNTNIETMFDVGPNIIQPFSFSGATGQPDETVTHLMPQGTGSSAATPDFHTGITGRGTTSTNQPITYNTPVVHHSVPGLLASLPGTYEYHFTRSGDFKAKKRTGDMASAVRTVSQLNALMNTVSARHQFGRYKDSAVVASVWRPLGALCTVKAPFEIEEHPVDSYPFRMAGNSRLLNIWLAQGSNPCKGSTLYLYWTREYSPLDNTYDLSAVGRDDGLAFLQPEDTDEDGDVDMQMLSAGSVLPGMVSRVSTTGSFTRGEKRAEDLNYRWQLKVFVSNDKQPPPVSLYHHADAIGTYYMIGSVIFESMVPSVVEMGCELQQVAQRALHPSDPSQDYRALFRNMFPMVTVLLGTT